MATFNAYLNFAGSTEAAFKFYQSVFGGELSEIMRIQGAPGGDKLSPADQGKVMHVSLSLGNNHFLHGTDALESMGQHLVLGNNVHIMVEADSKAQADQYFSALSAGGSVGMEMQDMFWGAYYGSLTDKFGLHWMVNFTAGP